jgi:hypothetical protein
VYVYCPAPSQAWLTRNLGYCGDSFSAGSIAAPAADCSFPCPADVSLTLNTLPFLQVRRSPSPKRAFSEERLTDCSAGIRTVWCRQSTFGIQAWHCHQQHIDQRADDKHDYDQTYYLDHHDEGFCHDQPCTDWFSYRLVLPRMLG